MKRFLLLMVFSHFAAPFLSFSQSTEDFSDETISGETITTNTGLIISSSNLNWSAYTNELNYNSVLLSPPSPYIAPSSNNDFFQITLSDQSKVFSSIEFDLWLNYNGMFGTGDMGCDCKSYTSENQLIETISKSSNEVAKNFIFNSGSIKKIICSPTNVEGGNNLHVDDIIFTVAQQENNNDILLNGTVSAENNKIKNVSDPTDAQDAATKNYVDSNVNSFSGSYNDLTETPTMYTQAQVDAMVANLQNQIDEPVYTIGHWPELGGYVFMVSDDGKHGLVAETKDQGFESWYNAQNLISNPSNHSANGQNFTDWKLPTRYELAQIYSQKTEIESAGGDSFGTKTYWTSNQSIFSVNGLEEETAWRQNFGNGAQYFSNAIRLNDELFVRSVREF